jgi:hypothetical protein
VIVLLSYGATYSTRRGAIITAPVPRARWVPIVAVSILIVVALIGNAAGFPYRPTIGPIAVAATWTLGCGATVFVLALNALWNDPAELRIDR